MNKKLLTAVVIIIILAIGIGLYFIYSSSNGNVINNPNDTAITYKNVTYGFNFSLPASWKGYSVIETSWEGNSLTSLTAPTGPKLIIRNPKWTAAAPYEDIPILVFTISQWNSYIAEEYSVSAAPILASELARNNMYVFALPPRWDFDYSLGFKEAEDIITGKPIQTFNSPTSLECHSSSKYFVVEKSLAPDAGSDILIKYKTDQNQNIPCVYSVASGDFEIKGAMAEYFLTFTDNFLVLDQGTAPEPRGLVVYDLHSRKNVYNDSYAKPVEVTGDSITYFSKTNTKPTIQNCSSLADYTKNGLGAVIMSKVTVNLSSQIKKDLSTTKCLATQ